MARKRKNTKQEQQTEEKKRELYNTVITSFNLFVSGVDKIKEEVKKHDFNMYIKSVYVFTCYEESTRVIQRYIIDKVSKYNFDNVEGDLDELRNFVHICDFLLFRYNEEVDSSNDEIHTISYTLFSMCMCYIDYLDETIEEFQSSVTKNIQQE